MRLRTVTFGALLGAATASHAWAQVPEIPSVKPEREFRVGASVNVTYDSNVAGTSEALARARGIEPDDVTVTPQATLALVQPVGRQVIFLKGVGGYNFYRSNDRLNRASYDVSGGAMVPVGSCQSTLYGSYNSQQSELSEDLAPVENRRRTAGVGVGVRCGVGAGLGGFALVQRFTTENSAVISRLSDNAVDTAAVGLSYSKPRLGRVGLSYSYSDTDLPNRNNPGQPVGDGYGLNVVSIDLQHDFGTRISLAGGFGKTWLNRDFAPAGVSAKSTSTNYNAVLNYRIGSRLEAEFSTSKSVKPSDRPGKLYDISTDGQAEARYRFGPRLQLALGHSISRVNSNVDSTIALPVVTKSKTNTTYGQLNYRVNDRVTLALNAEYRDRKANLADFNYDGYSVGATAGISF